MNYSDPILEQDIGTAYLPNYDRFTMHRNLENTSMIIRMSLKETVNVIALI
jgi:hypothetical protein